MNNEIKKEVAVRVPRMGDNEYRLAYSRATNQNDANELVALIDEHRQPLAEGRTANIRSATFASAETWQAIAEESETAAKRELLKNSAQLAELNELERKAREAKEAAEKKERELQAAWEEYTVLPDRIEKTEARISEINNGIRELDSDALAKQYQDIYKAQLKGATADRFALVFAAENIVTANMRKEVLNELSTS